jgi:hypothetical protein
MVFLINKTKEKSMAYVAISGELKDRVTMKIKHMKDKELKSLGDEPSRGFNPDSKFIEDITWKEHVHLKPLMPVEYVTLSEEIILKYKKDSSSYNVSCSFTHAGHFPPKSNFYGTSYEPNFDDPELLQLRTYLDAKHELLERWKLAQFKVIKFLESCKSLNEATKLWPDVTLYVDQDDIKRMGVKREKVKESKALEALKELDTDALVGNVVIARLAGN